VNCNFCNIRAVAGIAMHQLVALASSTFVARKIAQLAAPVLSQSPVVWTKGMSVLINDRKSQVPEHGRR
jgi:hypothetical protein